MNDKQTMDNHQFVEAIIAHCKGAGGMIKDDADSKLLMECAVKISGLQRRIDTWADYEETRAL